MQNLILHIGHPKTGSSYIQSFLALNENELKQGLFYPLSKNNIEAKKGFVTNGNGNNFLNSNDRLIYKFRNNYSTLYSDECFFYRLLNWEGFDNFFKKMLVK